VEKRLMPLAFARRAACSAGTKGEPLETILMMGFDGCSLSAKAWH
jgi:hypothetical protein